VLGNDLNFFCFETTKRDQVVEGDHAVLPSRGQRSAP
jgi:hypothetical protein